MFRNHKWVVVVEKLERGSSSGEGEITHFNFSSSKNALKHKMFERLNSNKK
jgi:hypothetical protein